MSNIYKDAMYSQGACNLGALIHGWDRAITQLQAEAQANGHGTDWINSHPVNVLFTEQVHHLTGYSQRYSAAYAECKEKADAPDARVVAASEEELRCCDVVGRDKDLQREQGT